MAKYAGVCLARQSMIPYTIGDILDPKRVEITGVSTTAPMPCEKFVDKTYAFVEVFIPALNGWVGFTEEEFNGLFLVVNGWSPER